MLCLEGVGMATAPYAALTLCSSCPVPCVSGLSPSQVAVPTQNVVGTPACLNTHQWQQASSTLRLAGRTGKVPAVAASALSASQWQEVPGRAWAGTELCGGRML